MDVAEHEHPPGPSGDPRRDPAERGRTGVQPLSQEGRHRRPRGRNPTGPRPRGPRPPPDERRHGGRIHRDAADAGTRESSPLDGPFLPPDPRPGAMAGARTVEVDIYRKPYLLTPEQANEAITPQTRMLLLIDPNNPLGSGYSRDQVRGLTEVARDHDLWIVDDITYRDFNPDHVLASGFYPEKTLVSYSFSKVPGLAGMRIGAILAPSEGPRSEHGPHGIVMQGLRKMDTNVLGVNVLA